MLKMYILKYTKINIIKTYTSMEYQITKKKLKNSGVVDNKEQIT